MKIGNFGTNEPNRKLGERLKQFLFQFLIKKYLNINYARIYQVIITDSLIQGPCLTVIAEEVESKFETLYISYVESEVPNQDKDKSDVFLDT